MPFLGKKDDVGSIPIVSSNSILICMRIRISELKKIVRDVLGETFADGSRKSPTIEGDEAPETQRSPGTPHNIEQLLTTMWDDDEYKVYGDRIPDSQYGTGPDDVDAMADTERSPETMRSRR